MDLVQKVEIFWETDAWPFLKNLFTSTVEDEIQALAPIAESAVATLVTDVATLGTPAGFVAAAAQVAAEVLKQAGQKALQVAGQSVLTSVSAALVNAQTAAQKTAAPAA